MTKKLEESSREFMSEQENGIKKLEHKVQEFTRLRDEDRAELSRLRQENIDLHTRVFRFWYHFLKLV